MSLSTIGFGHQPYGSEPFGHSDWAEEVTWKILPEFYRNLDAQEPGLVPNPLRGFINAVKPLLNELKAKWDIFPTLWDAEKCPFPQLSSLGYNVGIDITSIQTLGIVDLVAAPFTINEKVTGSQSASSGILNSANSDTFTLISVTGTGFRAGEILTGVSSGHSAKILSVSGVVPDQTLVVETFVVGETVTGLTTGTKGTIGSVSPGALNVDTVTGIGFSNGETISGETSRSSAVVNGITIDGRTEDSLRNQVLNANQLWINKGTDKGYKIVAAFDGLLVDITPLWAESCDPDPNRELLTVSEPEPGTYIAYYDAVPADILPTDRFFEDSFDAWPRKVDSVRKLPGLPPGICRSFSVDLFFYTPDNTEIDNFDSVSGRVINNIEKFRPIHIEFNKIRFSGTTAVSEQWRVDNLTADNSHADVFESSIIGDLLVASEIFHLDTIG